MISDNVFPDHICKDAPALRSYLYILHQYARIREKRRRTYSYKTEEQASELAFLTIKFEHLPVQIGCALF